MYAQLVGWLVINELSYAMSAMLTMCCVEEWNVCNPASRRQILAIPITWLS